MTGYSGTPLARKLGVKPGHVLALIDAPAGWAVPDLPGGVDVRTGGDGPADVLIILFVDRLADLDLTAPGRRIFPAGMVWVAWPRRAGGHTSDITDNDVRGHALSLGLVDVKVAALDTDWSGLKVVWRKENRGEKPPA
ncbi:DUF3052 domain-containing protein [Fodinicola feengrottensis]|uniref:DUF3052 domain-containing protein n=1 Tax=Fodinicola feengrottensis TaxID=435914 RepID=UPI0013D78CA0|nr:DUF3052 domain-containing protein [Fodinicola feengrottensis]